MIYSMIAMGIFSYEVHSLSTPKCITRLPLQAAKDPVAIASVVLLVDYDVECALPNIALLGSGLHLVIL